MDLNVLLNSLLLAWLTIAPLLQNLVLALILLLISFLVARALGWLTTWVFDALQLDKGAKKLGFNKILEKGDIKKGSSELLGDLVYWVIAAVAVFGTLGLFGLPVMKTLIIIFAYMGVIFLAALILGVGLFLASVTSTIVKLVLANLGIDGAKTAARVIYYIVVIFAFLAALSELGISPDVFVPQIGVIIGAFGLAAAIAFGLGCKDMAADFLYGLFKGK